MENCTPKKISKLLKDLKKIDVDAEIKSDAIVVITVGKREDGGSFYQPIRRTAKMRSGWIISAKGRVNLFLRKFWAKRGDNNQIIASSAQESSVC